MSAFSGRQDNSGPKKGRRNKGVMATHRAEKRLQAEIRNEEYQARKRVEDKEDAVEVFA